MQKNVNFEYKLVSILHFEPLCYDDHPQLLLDDVPIHSTEFFLF